MKKTLTTVLTVATAGARSGCTFPAFPPRMTPRPLLPLVRPPPAAPARVALAATAGNSSASRWPSASKRP